MNEPFISFRLEMARRRYVAWGTNSKGNQWRRYNNGDYNYRNYNSKIVIFC